MWCKNILPAGWLKIPCNSIHMSSFLEFFPPRGLHSTKAIHGITTSVCLVLYYFYLIISGKEGLGFNLGVLICFKSQRRAKTQSMMHLTPLSFPEEPLHLVEEWVGIEHHPFPFIFLHGFWCWVWWRISLSWQPFQSSITQ